MFFQLGSYLFNRCIIHIDSIVFVDHLGIIPNFPLAAHIHREPAQLKLQRAKRLLKHIFIHCLHKAHALLPVPVRSIPLHSDVLWQMLI